jgi:hypothetical protein
MTKQNLMVPLAALALVASGATATFAVAHAADTSSTTSPATTQQKHAVMHYGMRGHGPGMGGTVTAVNGSTITITGKDGKTYTVDASSATAQKLQTISVSDIRVGDEIGVMGTLSGTSITAKNIMDGMPTFEKSGS